MDLEDVIYKLKALKEENYSQLDDLIKTLEKIEQTLQDCLKI